MPKNKSTKAKAKAKVQGKFSLNKFKSKKGLDSASVKFKKQEWIPLSKAFQEAVSIPGIPTGHITLLRGHSDTGKAQPLSSNILTPTGWVKMGELKVNDSVIGSDGKPKKVLGIYPQGKKTVWEVHFTDGSVVETCGEHLWEVETYRDRRSNYGRKRRLEKLGREEQYYDQCTIKTTAEISEEVNIAPSPKKNPNLLTRNHKVRVISEPVEYSSGNSNFVIPPYVLGVLIGDGTLSSSGINITSVDSHILFRVEKLLSENLELRQVADTITYGIRSSIPNYNEYIRQLKEYDLLRKSESKFIPKEYIYSSAQDRLELLHGLMDTDGTLDPNGVHTYYSTASEQLANDVQELVRSLGMGASISFRPNEFKGCYKVTIVDNGKFDLFSLPRKKQKHIKKSKYPAAKYIDKVVCTEREEDMQCIYIDSDDHLYVTDGYTLTHNTTGLLEASVAAQKLGILPVFIITEMKWSWEHAREMGLKFEEVVDEDTGEITDYEGFFLYVDRGTINTIEDVAGFIADLLDEQKKGNLPYDLCFFWDSIGSVPCELSVKSNKNNNEWNAGAMSTQFSNHLNQKILLSRKQGYPYTNTLVAVNKVWTMKPESPMGAPKLQNKGGMSMWYDASIVVTFGNITNPGTSKIRAVKDGKQVEFAKRTNVQVEKNHISGVTTKGRIAMTQHGFIEDSKKAVDKYKSDHRDRWLEIFGSSDFDLIEEGDLEEDQSLSPDKDEK